MLESAMPVAYNGHAGAPLYLRRLAPRSPPSLGLCAKISWRYRALLLVMRWRRRPISGVDAADRRAEAGRCMLGLIAARAITGAWRGAWSYTEGSIWSYGRDWRWL